MRAVWYSWLNTVCWEIVRSRPLLARSHVSYGTPVKVTSYWSICTSIISDLRVLNQRYVSFKRNKLIWLVANRIPRAGHQKAKFSIFKSNLCVVFFKNLRNMQILLYNIICSVNIGNLVFWTSNIRQTVLSKQILRLLSLPRPKFLFACEGETFLKEAKRKVIWRLTTIELLADSLYFRWALLHCCSPTIIKTHCNNLQRRALHRNNTGRRHAQLIINFPRQWGIRFLPWPVES